MWTATTSAVWCIYGVSERGIFDGVQHTYAHKNDIYAKFYTGLYIGMLLYILDCGIVSLLEKLMDHWYIYDYNRVWF